MRPPTGEMMEGLLVSNSPFLGDFLDPPLFKPGCQRLHLETSNTLFFFLIRALTRSGAKREGLHHPLVP